MYEIINISELELQSKTLILNSAYCMINLISERIYDNKYKINDNLIIDEAFLEYDFDGEKRPSNNEYTKYADIATNKLKLR